MNPNGQFVQNLNLASDIKNRPIVFTIASNFEAKSSSIPFLRKMGAILLDEGVLDPLFAQANDLVVDTASSGHLTPEATVQGEMCYEPESGVYHLNYFTQQATQEQLKKWLVQDEVAGII
jgi:hypothetical protein